MYCYMRVCVCATAQYVRAIYHWYCTNPVILEIFTISKERKKMKILPNTYTTHGVSLYEQPERDEQLVLFHFCASLATYICKTFTCARIGRISLSAGENSCVAVLYKALFAVGAPCDVYIVAFVCL